MKGVDVSTPAPTSKNATRQRDDALTERQHLVLDAIRKHIAEQGFAPSFREIGEAVGLKSPSSVKHQLHALERKGYLHISANKGRAYKHMLEYRLDNGPVDHDVAVEELKRWYAEIQ